MGKSIRRPLNNRIFAGVCSAIAKFFDLDVKVIRIVWVIFSLFAGGGVLLYLILWVVIPSE